jgi:V8-like Glu-specific endopeptidase
LSLTAVSPSAGNPFTAITELQATFPDHKTFDGSGVMVDRFHVLTAGHMVYSYADGGWATSILAIPDLNGTNEPFGEASMTYERTFTTWMNYSKAHPGSTAPGDLDIALVTLDEDLGNFSGWMSYGYNNNNAQFAAGVIANTAGYPATAGYSGQQMEFSSGALAGLSSDGSALEYYQSSITTYAGQSGSPVWEYFPSTGQSIVYGIHVGGTGAANSLNFATRITQSIYNTITQWRSSDRDPDTGPIEFVAPANGSSHSLETSATGVTSPSASIPNGQSRPERAQFSISLKTVTAKPVITALPVPRGAMRHLGQSLEAVRKFL